MKSLTLVDFLILFLYFLYRYYTAAILNVKRKVSLQCRKLSVFPRIFRNFLTDNLAVFATVRADTIIGLGESHLTIAAIRSEVDSNNVFHFSFSCSFYIGIIPTILEVSREIWQFLCQEILTKLFTIILSFGIPFANSICRAIFFRSGRKLLWYKHLRQIRPANLALSSLVARLYVKFRLPFHYRKEKFFPLYSRTTRNSFGIPGTGYID